MTQRRILPGTAAYRRVTLAMFLAGLATFALLYETQALLPFIAGEYATSSSQASLTVSAATGMLAVAILPVSALSERWAREYVMVGGLVLAGILGLVAALAPNLPVLLLLRGAQGAALASVPAVAVAYLGERVDAAALGQTVGSYVAGNALGGLAGRLVPSVIADLAGWRAGIAGLACVALGLTVALYLAMPRSRVARHPVARDAVPLRALIAVAGRHLADPRLRALYALAFCCMGAFVALYNYLAFRLVAPPYGIRPALVGLVYLSYLAGTLSSLLAGRLADRWGRRQVVLLGVGVFACGVLLTLLAPLAAVLAGVVVATVGFFTAHATASGWVARRVSHSRAQASALYLLAYYAGSSVLGWSLGLSYEQGGWPWLVACIAVVLALATVVAGRLGRA